MVVNPITSAVVIRRARPTANKDLPIVLQLFLTIVVFPIVSNSVLLLHKMFQNFVVLSIFNEQQFINSLLRA